MELISIDLYLISPCFLCSIVAFLVAFCCLFFQKSTTEARAWVGSLSFIVAVLIIWCIVTYWNSPVQEEEESNRPLVQAESQVDDEPETDDGDEEKSKHGIWAVLDTIRHIPYLVYRRHSVDSERTPV